MRVAHRAAVLAIALISTSTYAVPPLKADKVIVHKKDRLLIVLNRGKELKRYRVALGASPVGPKTRQGDHKTPEGIYVLDRRNPQSQFYKSIHMSYPTAEQVAAARRAHVSPGGDIFIHGLGKRYGWVGTAHRTRDWTDGCIAVTNEEIDEIWSLVADGTPIEIRP